MSPVSESKTLLLCCLPDMLSAVDKKPGETDKPETFEIKGLYTFKNKKASQHQHGEFKVCAEEGEGIYTCVQAPSAPSLWCTLNALLYSSSNLV